MEKIMSNSDNKALEYTDQFYDALSNTIKESISDLPKLIQNKITITSYGIDGLELKIAYDNNDWRQVSSEIGEIVGGFIGGYFGKNIKIVSSIPIVGKKINETVDKIISITIGAKIGSDIGDNIATSIYDYFTNKSGLNSDLLVISSFMQGLENSILNTLLGQDKAHANFAESELQTLQTQINQSTNQANQFIAPPVRRDPLAFDLDGDGIEITNTNNGVMFDHNNNNVKTNTAWLSGNDAWLTLDKNKNGVIDNGAELFGDNTIKQDGTTAKDGIDALKDLDNNQDGIINNQDIQFANLKLWQDTNQDGISQQTELKNFI
jgi:hypothetical protein